MWPRNRVFPLSEREIGPKVDADFSLPGVRPGWRWARAEGPELARIAGCLAPGVATVVHMDATESPLFRVMVELGAMTIAAAQVENMLRMVCAELSGGTAEARLAVAGQSVTWMIKESKARVAEYRADASSESGSAESLDRLADVLARCSDAMGRRNAVVHGYPVMDGEDGRARFYRSRRGMAEPEKTKPGHLHGLNDDLTRVNADLMLTLRAWEQSRTVPSDTAGQS